MLLLQENEYAYCCNSAVPNESWNNRGLFLEKFLQDTESDQQHSKDYPAADDGTISPRLRYPSPLSVEQKTCQGGNDKRGADEVELE